MILRNFLSRKGTIVPSQGPSNFGWDPIFQPAGFKNT
jgi:inosine/xanthosine triphosphate pyrophosphatase family protein